MVYATIGLIVIPAGLAIIGMIGIICRAIILLHEDEVFFDDPGEGMRWSRTYASETYCHLSCDDGVQEAVLEVTEHDIEK